MESAFEYITEKDAYIAPTLEIYLLAGGKDVLCMSTESNDNDFSAGGMGQGDF
jgi:hypothetical protein